MMRMTGNERTVGEAAAKRTRITSLKHTRGSAEETLEKQIKGGFGYDTGNLTQAYEVCEGVHERGGRVLFRLRL